MYRYRPDVLRELERHGVRPTPDTPPELVRDFVRDLYKYEIRRLRDRLMSGAFPKSAYAGLVARLRQSYPVLALPSRLFLEPQPTDHDRQP